MKAGQAYHFAFGFQSSLRGLSKLRPLMGQFCVNINKNGNRRGATAVQVTEETGPAYISYP